jgi:hypothetical protein
MKNNELKCSNFTDEMLGELADIKFGKSHFSYKNEAGDMDFVRLGNFSVLMCNAFDEGDQPVYFAIDQSGLADAGAGGGHSTLANGARRQGAVCCQPRQSLAGCAGGL